MLFGEIYVNLMVITNSSIYAYDTAMNSVGLRRRDFGILIALGLLNEYMGKILVLGAVLMAVILIVAMFGCSKKSDNSVTPLDGTDRQFVTNAGFNNDDEINAGYLASTNAPDSVVRAFGHMMINDYTAAQSTLILLADSLGFTVVSSPDSAHASELSALQSLTGVAFDTTYLRLQINDDQSAITLYQAEQGNGQNASVKAYVSHYLPMIQAHLSTADTLIRNWEGH